MSSEPARRAFLAEVEHALATHGVPDLTCVYRAPPPPHVPHGALVAAVAPASLAPTGPILVVTLPGAPGAVRVAAVTAVRRVAATRPGAGGAALEQVRAHARTLGIVAVSGTFRTSEPFPGDGTPEYEVTIVEPAPPEPAGAAGPTHAEAWPEGRPVEQRYLADAGAVAALIVEWAAAMRRRTPPGPRDKAELQALRAIAQARRRALAAVDWSHVAALQAAVQLTAAWQAAGLDVAFDPADPDAGIDGGIDAPASQPAPSLPSAERLLRGLAGSGLGAIVDLGVLTERLNEHLERVRAAIPAPAPTTPPAPAFTDAARTALREDLAALSPRQLLWHLPRDEQGRLLLGERVLLAAYDSAAPLGQGRRLWLVAALPARRRDPQVPALRLLSLIGANHTHRWDEARWRWDARAQDTPAEQRWGIAGLPLDQLGPDAWRTLAPPPESEGAEAAAVGDRQRTKDERRIRPSSLVLPPEGAIPSNFEGTAGAPTADDLETLAPGERAARGLLLQDAGRFEEALALYGIALAPEVARLIRGEPLGWRGRALAEPWARAAQAALRDAALWRFGPLLAEAAEARARWLAEKRGRKRPLPELRLLRLPKQTGQTKAVLALAAREADGGRPWLTLAWTGADDRLPAAAWRRDLDLDLLRLRLLAPADLPYTT